MISALNAAVSGMQANALAMDVVGNNTANANTVGFVPKRAVFSDAGGNGGTKVEVTASQGAQGALYQTGMSSDLALAGAGYFEVETAPGVSRYTRSGVFVRDAEGFLRSPSGAYLMGQGGRVRIPQNATDYQVTPEGAVSSYGESGAVIDRQDLRVVSFANANGLAAEGGSLFSATSASGTATPVDLGGAGTRVFSGALEMSQTDIVAEQVQMILTQRAFEANARVISVSDEMLKKVYSK